MCELYIWLLSLSVMSAGFIHVIAYISTFFLLPNNMDLSHILFIHPSVDARLDYLHFLAVMSNAATKTSVQGFRGHIF